MRAFRSETLYCILSFAWSVWFPKTMILRGVQEEPNSRMNLLIFLPGVLVRNGGSFEDDLSLGAEGTFVCIFT